MPRRNFNNNAYRARQARARRQQAIREAQRRIIQALYRNERIPTRNRPQEAVLMIGNETVRRAQAEYYQPPIATRPEPSYGTPAIATLLTQQDRELPIATRVIDPREAHNNYMRMLGLNPNFRPST